MNHVNKKFGFAKDASASVENTDTVIVSEEAQARVLETEDKAARTDTEGNQSGPAENAMEPPPASAQATKAAPLDATVLMRALHSGENKVAKQADLVQLHQSLVTSLKSLGAGIGDQVAKSAEQDRKLTEQRMVEMEQAVNGMEGLLRIQLAPEIKNMIETSLQEHSKSVPNRRAIKVIGVGLIMLSFVAGAIFSEQFFNIIKEIENYAALHFSKGE